MEIAGITVYDCLLWHDGYPEELKAGMILEEESGKRFLVGHVNACSGGECDCCGRYRNETRDVVRWCQLVEIDNSGL